MKGGIRARKKEKKKKKRKRKEKDNIINNFEGVACYCRNPGDAPMNARSGRDRRSRPKLAKFANRASSEIHCFV